VNKKGPSARFRRVEAPVLWNSWGKTGFVRKKSGLVLNNRRLFNDVLRIGSLWHETVFLAEKQKITKRTHLNSITGVRFERKQK
jgi:hypothetical protein